MMDWHDLEHFRAAARSEHLGHAADELGVSQSTLTRTVARLEQRYKVRLFDRIGRSVRLNPYGRVLLERVEHALLELENADRELAQLAGRAEATVALGFLATFGMTVVPRLIQEFRAQQPAAEFRLFQGAAPVLREHVRSGDIDLCLTSPRFLDTELSWEPLWEEDLVAIVPPDHRLRDAGEIALADLANDPMVALKPGYGLRHYLDRFAGEAGFAPRVVFEGDEVATLVGLVGAGFGVSLVPKSVETVPSVAVALRIRIPRCARTVGLAWRTERYATPLVAAFRDHTIARLRRDRAGGQGSARLA